MENTLTLGDINRGNSFEAQCLDAKTDITVFYQLINNEIINWIIWAEQHKDMLCNCGEDLISFNLVTHFQARFQHTFYVTHDNHAGGHVDIHIKSNRYLWLGEAKLSDGSAYSLKGFQQLVDRYTSGSPTCKEGGLFIYIINKSAKKKATIVLKEWKAKLETEIDDIENLVFLEPHEDRAGLSLITQHTHNTSGLPYKVHHYIVQLQHFPTDGQ
ncbi:hypothetical protein [Neisseria dentiae]|uniref:hypothetical protein n=1 Tax=Neisseria dentiae TaxID=194197 RepID=UPI000DFDFF4E|nr:hypothetical protein [Neisseria dentiae]QMT45686.1 hypothetical protein H3L92_02400 [Neisseria dentiae]STZ51624.1 Uncharacterised protein [Neisseria dentiae]